MRVQLYVQRVVNGVHCSPYEIVELPDDVAQGLVAAGSARSLDPPRPVVHHVPQPTEPEAAPRQEE